MIKPIPFIDLQAQKNRLNHKITNRVSDVLKHGQFIMGPEVVELEKKLEDFTGARYAVTCGSGTDALILALMAYNIGPGDVVFCPSFTFPATAEAIAILGAEPYFVDVESDTFNISIKSLEKGIKEINDKNQLKNKAIIAVDLYGLPADYDRLINLSKENNMVLIADAAQSFGAKHNNKNVGAIADITCVSFFPAKPLGCYGDGGAVLTDNLEIKDKLSSLRAHGKGKSKYEIDYIGLNSRLDTIQAAILLAKLEDFKWEFHQRNLIAEKYSLALKNITNVPEIPKGFKSIWAQYTIKVDNREYIQNSLKEKNIPSMVYYPIPMHLQPAYKKYYRKPLINSEELSKVVLSLPMYPDMTEEIQDYIVTNLMVIL